MKIREKGLEKICEEIVVKISLTWEKKKNHPSPESIESSRQHKLKEEHAEMHRNQTDKKFKTNKKY